MRFRTHIKETVVLAYPVVIAQLGHMLFGITDSIMVGGIGAVPLAASAIGNGIFFIIMVIGIGISYAISPLTAIKIGEGKMSECGEILNQAIILNALVSFLLTMILFLGAESIYYIGQPKEVAEQAVVYLRILSLSAGPFMIFQTFRQFVEGFGATKPPMIVTLAANILNVFANWVLIYGKLGFPRMELAGAGLATLATRTFLAASIVFYTAKAKKFAHYYKNIELKNLNKDVLNKLLRIGLPSGIQYFFEVGAFVLASFFVGWIGSRHLAAHQIAVNLASITYMMALGVSTSGGIRVGREFGSRNMIGAKKAGYAALSLSALIMTTGGVIFVIFRNLLPRIYINDPNVVEIASGLLIIAALFQIFDGTQAVGLGILRGLMDAKMPTVIAFISYWIIALPLAYILGISLKIGIIGIWIGLSIGLIASASMLTGRFLMKIKRIQKNDI